MKKAVLVLMVVACLLLLFSAAQAETLYLKNGRTVSGKIMERTATKVRIDSDGLTMTYYLDEIDRIEDAGQEPQALSKTSSAAEPGSGASRLAPLQALERKEPGPSAATDRHGSIQSTGADLTGLSKRDLILKYMEVTGVKGNMRQTFSQIIKDAPADKQAPLRRALDINKVLNKLVPVYDQYFTDRDLMQLIKFYESPLGQKLLKTGPLLLKDSMETSLKYFEETLGPDASELDAKPSGE